jgi:hypothetical protein
MLFSLLYFLVRRLLGTGSRPQDEKDIELLVLRHEVKVLQRQGNALVSIVLTDSCWRRQAGLCQEACGPHSSSGPRPCSLAPGARQAQVDMQEEESPGPAADRARSPGPHRPVGPGEPPVGLPAHPRRAVEAGHPGLRDDGPVDPAPPRPSPCSPKDRPNLDPVPPVTGGGHPCLRFLHRRDDQAEDDLRPLLHRASEPESARGGRHRAPRLGVGNPAGEEPRDRRT